MIVTVTPNPSLDRTVQVDRLVPGAVHRAFRAHLDPGGKGVNVARALAAAGVPTLAVLPSGGAVGARLAEL
ncbi:PfkB family carbohydrate kinase, partial [Saccharopolyspora spinosa]